MKELQSAVRQYQHNDCSGLVMGYDREETERVVSELLRERNELAAKVERLRFECVDIMRCLKTLAYEHNHADVPRYKDLAMRCAEKIRDRGMETPAQSLEAVKREWKERFIDYARKNAEYGLGDSLSIPIDELKEL